MRKTLIILLCLSIVTLLVGGCSKSNVDISSGVGEIEESATALRPPTIACIYVELTGEFWGIAANGANAVLEELKADGKISGDSYLVAPSTSGDIEQQKVLIDEAINKKVDGIVLSAAHADEIGAYLSDSMPNLADGGIPIIAIDRSISVPDTFDCVVSSVMADTWAMGNGCGELAMEALGGNGEYICIAQNPWNCCWENRATGAIDFIEKMHQI